MGTSPTVITARQQGKSVLTAVFDEWTAANNKIEPCGEPVYLEFNANPLALVCAMLRKGKQAYEAAEVLNGVGTRIIRQIDISQSIEREDEDRANAILKYFAKKHTMRRIKGEWVSEYMLALDDIVDNPKRLNKEHVGILVSLPRIYEQNRALERVMKGHKSAPKFDDLHWPSMEGELEFVDKLNMKTNKNNELHYFWRTPKNYLVRVVLRKGYYGSEAWDVLAKHGKIHVSAEHTYTHGIKGYDFNVLQTSPEHTEIKIV